jgi:hypothetical protein
MEATEMSDLQTKPYVERELVTCLQWATRFAEGSRDADRQFHPGEGLDIPGFNTWIDRCKTSLETKSRHDEWRGFRAENRDRGIETWAILTTLFPADMLYVGNQATDKNPGPEGVQTVFAARELDSSKAISEFAGCIMGLEISVSVNPSARLADQEVRITHSWGEEPEEEFAPYVLTSPEGETRAFHQDVYLTTFQPLLKFLYLYRVDQSLAPLGFFSQEDESDRCIAECDVCGCNIIAYMVGSRGCGPAEQDPETGKWTCSEGCREGDDET